MATSYHLSPNGPRLCKAQRGLCPYAAQGEPHYENQAEAQVAYETRMSEAFGNLETVRRTSGEKLRQKTYGERDLVSAKVKAVKASAPVQDTLSALRAIKDAPRRMEERGAARMEARRVELEALRVEAKAKINRIGARISETSVKADAKVNSVLKDLYGLRGMEEDAIQHFRAKPVHRLQVGDRLIDGNKVAKVVDNGETIKLHLRGPNGRFAGMITLNDSDVVNTYSPTKRELRGGIRRQLKKLSESPFAQRVRVATAVQREAFQILRGVDSSKITRTERLPIPDRSALPLDARYRRSTASSAARRENMTMDFYRFVAPAQRAKRLQVEAV